MENVTTTPDQIRETEAAPDLAAMAGASGTDQAPAQSREDNTMTPQEALEILKPKIEPKTWVLGEGTPYERSYVQREMSFISKMQWFALVGEVLDKSMSGDNALSMNSLLSGPGDRGQALTVEDFRDADTFIQAVGKLLVHAPDFLEKSFCIWLAVPDYDWETTRKVMAFSPEEGGLSDKDGLEIIEIFIDQNYGALDSFFREKLGQLRDRVEARQKQALESRSSRR